MVFNPSKEVLWSPDKLRLGVVGKPSDWLIASHVDYEDVLRIMNIELIDIPIERMTSLGEVDPGMKGAETIYEHSKNWWSNTTCRVSRCAVLTCFPR